MKARRNMTRYFTLTPILILLALVSVGRLEQVAPGAMIFRNTTLGSNENGTGTLSFISAIPSITPPPLVGVTSSDNIAGQPLTCFASDYLTSFSRAPYSDWLGNQTIPENDCYTPDSSSPSCHRWLDFCTINFGDVRLVYFPPNKDNTHISTKFDKLYDYTFTSPSVYMVWTTISAGYECPTVDWYLVTRTHTLTDFDATEIVTETHYDAETAQLGPLLRNVIIPFDLSDISTLEVVSGQFRGPRLRTTTTGTNLTPTSYSIPTPQPLVLSDLYSDCPAAISALPEDIKEFGPNWVPMMQNPSSDPRIFRCNPFLFVPPGIKSRLGDSFWRDCELLNEENAFPDPPYALEFDSAVLPVEPAGPPPQNNPGNVATPQQSADPGLPQKTSPPVSQQLPVSNSMVPGKVAGTSDVPTSGKGSPTPGNTPPNNPPEQKHSQSNTVGQNRNSLPQANDVSTKVFAPGNDPGAKDEVNPSMAVPIVTIGTNIISVITEFGEAKLGANVILPGGAKISANDVTTLIPSGENEKPVVISVIPGSGAAAGKLFLSTVDSNSATTIPLLFGKTAVYMSQTLVITYGHSGIIVQYPGGSASTVSINGGTTLSSATTGGEIGAAIMSIWVGGGSSDGSANHGNNAGPSFEGEVFAGSSTGGLNSGNRTRNSSITFTGVGGPQTTLNIEFGLLVLFLVGISLL